MTRVEPNGFWSWYAKESTRWFQADVDTDPQTAWDLANSAALGHVPGEGQVLEYFVARGRLTHGADVINTWNTVPNLVSTRLVTCVEDAGLTGVRFAAATVVDRKDGATSQDYRVPVPTAVIKRRMWTEADHRGGPDDMGDLRLFRGYPVDVSSWGGEDFVRVEGTAWLLVSKRAYEVLTAAKLTGLELEPADGAKLSGYLGDYVPW